MQQVIKNHCAVLYGEVTEKAWPILLLYCLQYKETVSCFDPATVIGFCSTCQKAVSSLNSIASSAAPSKADFWGVTYDFAPSPSQLCVRVCAWKEIALRAERLV